MRKTLSIPMTFGELRWGIRYLLFQMLVLPWLVQYISVLLPVQLSVAAMNFIIYCVNFAAITVILRRFLGLSLGAAWRDMPRVGGCVAIGLCAYWAANLALGAMINAVAPDFANVNDAVVEGMLQENYLILAIATVLLVPVAEECMFRGLFFQALHRKSRILAYLVSTLVFCGIHVGGYVGSADAVTLALCFVQYIPAGLILAWAYEAADTIAAPILIHMLINAMGVALMR